MLDDTLQHTGMRYATPTGGLRAPESARVTLAFTIDDLGNDDWCV